MKNLIGEIHRRSMWQVLGIYAAASWVVLQIVDTLAGALGLPEWAASLALFLLIIGLPIVLATAFVQGGMRSKPPAKDTETKPVTGEGTSSSPAEPIPTTGVAKFLTWRNALMGGVLSFALLGVAGTAWVVFGSGTIGSSAASDPSADSDVAKSIAVLPFTTVGEENEAFRVGIHDALLAQLAKVSDLRVISRTSTLEYEGTTKNMRQIGDELGVASLVEGSVQRADDVVQINVQLIDTGTDEHRWSESYIRDLSAANLIAVQSEIVRDISRELSAVLSPEEEARIAAVPTENLEAYDLFLRARDAQQQDSRESRLETVELLEQVVALDSSFALAWAYLSIGHSDVYWHGYDLTDERAERARDAADRALDLDPTLPEVGMAMGAYFYHAERDYEAALRELNAARERMGETAWLVGMIGFIQRRQGDLEAAAASLRRAEQLDPRAPTWGQELGQTLQVLGEFDDAARAIDRTLNLDPDNSEAWGRKTRNPLFATGDIAAAQQAYDESLAAGARISIPPVWTLAGLSGDTEPLLEVLEDAPELIQVQDGSISKAFYEAEARLIDGDERGARGLFDSARVVLERLIETEPRNLIGRIVLARVYARLDLRDDALEMAAAAIEKMPDDAWAGPWWLDRIARIYGLLGETDQAIELLQSTDWADRGLLRLSIDPDWAPLREDPRFQELSERERALWESRR